MYRDQKEDEIVQRIHSGRGGDGIHAPPEDGVRSTSSPSAICYPHQRVHHHNPQRRAEGVHPHLLAVPDVVRAEGHQQRGDESDLAVRRAPRQSVDQGDQQDAEE